MTQNNSGLSPGTQPAPGADADSPDHLRLVTHPVSRTGDGQEPAIGPIADSAEPAVVFASLAARCVPEACTRVVIDLVEDEAEYSVAYPPGDTSDHATTLPVSHTVRHTFAAVDTWDRGDDEVGFADFRGRATFFWDHREPSATDRFLVVALTDQAVQHLACQRSRQVTRAAKLKIDNLAIALQTSRDIGVAVGILMSQHKMTREQAFDVLRRVSQHTHLKVRELALDVIDAGWLDPAQWGLLESRASRTR